MAYATQADIVTLYGEIALTQAADRQGDGTSDTEAITDALTYATGEMDSYIGVKYSLPLATPVPASLVKPNVDIALYNLSADGPSYTEEKRQRYEDAIDWLKRLAKGEATLGIAAPPTTKGGGPVVTYETRVSTRTTQAGLW